MELITAHSPVNIDGSLRYLGDGKEGFVFHDNSNIHKLIDTSPKPLDLIWQLTAFAERIREMAPVKCVHNIRSVTLCAGKQVLIQYPFVASSDFFTTPPMPITEYARLLREFRRIGWVCSDISPKNLRVLTNGSLILADVGHGLLPFSQMLFNNMCRRAFVIHKLHAKMEHISEFKPYLTAVNNRADFSQMTRLGFNQRDLDEQYEKFYRESATATKVEALNPVLNAIFSDNIAAKTVLDYGSGHGDHAQMLVQLGIRVTAYEPDEEVVEKHRVQYYANVNLVDHAALTKLKSNDVTFDAVLCSLVLCHPLANSERKQLAKINAIMDDVTALSRRHIVIVICNPLYTSQLQSQLQLRQVPTGFSYYKATPYHKKMIHTGRKMPHTHRPFSFYEELFRKRGLEIRQIIQTEDITQTISTQNSDFTIFMLSKSNAQS